MNEATVTFEQVFDVTRNVRRSRVPSTEFGFQAGEMKVQSVLVSGSPRIEAGMTVTALLDRPGDWQSLLGWVDHETGEIASQRPGSHVGGIVAMVLGGFLASHLLGTKPLVATLVLVVSVACLVPSAAGMRKALRARRRLESIRATLARRDPGAGA